MSDRPYEVCFSRQHEFFVVLSSMRRCDDSYRGTGPVRVPNQNGSDVEENNGIHSETMP